MEKLRMLLLGSLLAGLVACVSGETEESVNLMSSTQDVWYGQISQSQPSWMVDLEYTGWYNPGHRCGATLIAPEWIVTAAHCVTSPAINTGGAAEFRAWFNRNPRSSGTGFWRAITEIHLPEGEYVLECNHSWGGGPSNPGYYGWNNDIALLRLNQPVSLGAAALPAGAPSIGATGTAYGWGICSQGEVWGGLCNYWNGFPDELRQIDLTIDSLNATNIFTHDHTNISAGLGSGDSGGPFAIGSTLLGINSFAYSFLNPPWRVSGMQRVDAHLQWITDTIADPPCYRDPCVEYVQDPCGKGGGSATF